MFDQKKDHRLNRAIILYFLIWFLFVVNSALAFWQFVGIYQYGNVAGTIYFNNGVTPLPINGRNPGTFIELMNTTTDSRTAYFTSDDFGRYTSPQVPQGSYYLKVIFDDKIVGISTDFDINASEATSVDITASMKPLK